MLNSEDIITELQEKLYLKITDMINIVSSEMDVTLSNSESYSLNQPGIGEICIVRCKAENEQVIVMVVIYNPPNQSIKKITEFLQENCLHQACFSERKSTQITIDFEEILM